MSMTERVPLTRSRIVAAAMVLADADGIDALSMRKIGSALGVEAMSLYNHVTNKDDLINGVVDAMIAEIELPSSDVPWDVQVRSIAHGFRRAGHHHPRIFPLLGSRPIASVDGLRPLVQCYAAMRHAGLGADDALDAFISLASFVFGFVLTELSGLIDVDELPVDLSALDAAADADLIEMGGALLTRQADRQFAFGVEQNLRGLRELIVGA